MPTDPQITAVVPARRAEALQLVFSHLTPQDQQRQAETMLDDSAGPSGGLEGLWAAYRDDRLVGAVLAQTQLGRTANIWLPRTAAGEPSATAQRLLVEVSDWLNTQDVRVAQVLLETVAEGDANLLRQGGFQRLADLLYLVCTENELPTEPPGGPLEFEPYSTASHRRLAALVEATYRQTLDCPQLNEVRQIEDVLAGYRAAGVFHPSRWLIVRHRQQDVGCLLLADYPREENWELVYMGVAAEARGHGWGLDIVRHAQWLARQGGRPRLVLAVDAENEPAIRIYAAAGFAAWDRRTAYARVMTKHE